MNKQVILSKAKALLQQKQLELMAMLTDLNDGLANDTKSSAGDKYETSRAMSQQEIDKVAVQLRETKRQLALLPLLEAKTGTPAIENGSLVKTNASCFYISLPIGRIEVENELVYCISSTAPIAQKLLGLKVDDSFEMAGAFHKILEIL